MLHFTVLGRAGHAVLDAVEPRHHLGISYILLCSHIRQVKIFKSVLDILEQYIPSFQIWFLS